MSSAALTLPEHQIIPGSKPLSRRYYEDFAQLAALGYSFAAAAKGAGSKAETTIYNTGSRTAAIPQVRDRIAYLKSRVEAEPDEVRKPWVVQNLRKTFNAAFEAKAFTASVACLQTLAKIGGFYGEKTPASAPRNVSVDARQTAIYLQQQTANLPEAARAALLSQAPELAEILDADTTSAECTASGESSEPASD